jgi:hypothetical protein
MDSSAGSIYRRVLRAFLNIEAVKVAQSRRKMLCVACAAALLPVALAEQDSSTPTADQRKILDSIRAYAGDYISNLPNFICQQVTQQLEAGKKPTRWHKGDTIVSKLVFTDGREQRSLESINDKPAQPSRFVRRPLVTEGEFGVLLANVLNEKTQATFSWSGWQMLRGRRVAVFDFDVAREHSTLRLSLSDLAQATVPYRGSVFADPSSGAVLRITNSAYDIPAAVRTKSIATTIDYDPVSIAGRDYLLPVEASVLLDTGSHHVWNRMQFHDYQKFGADSTITFGSEPPAK